MADTAPQAPQTNPMRRVFGLRDFRLLFAGTSLSLLGDQFALIATPWLVLQLTGDPMALGIVLALEGLPRAAFMLIGGAMTDRLSPRRMMLIADTIRLIVSAMMAFTVLSGTIDMALVYGFAFGFGLVAGFSVPAENSIVPMLVAKTDLQAGNSVIMGVTQIAGFVGPSLAGIVIGAFPQSLAGVGLAYVIDAASFAASALSLVLIGRDRPAKASGEADAWEGIFAAIRTAFFYLWDDDVLRLMFLLLAAINFLLIGPLLIGIPLIAKTRLAEGALAFGLLMAAFSAGNLIGFLIAGAAPRPGAGWIRAILLAVLFGFSLVIAALGFIPSTLADFLLLLGLGIGNGYIAILLFTFMQTRTPEQMLGRVMSFLLFANTGLVPLSQAISGAVGRWDLNILLLAAGGLTGLVSLWAMTRPELLRFAADLARKGAPTAG